jgi:hypothetical protein
MLHVVGSDYEERRQTALAALLELGQFDAVREEFTGRFREGQRLFAESLRQNKETLLRQLAVRWADLERTLGEQAFIEFTYGGEQLSFANQLSAVIEEGQAPRAWLHGLFSETDKGVSFGLLEFLARSEPGSERLLALCVNILHGRVKTPLYGWADQSQTSALLAAHWGGDEAVLGQLTSGVSPDQLPAPVVIALTLGWPDSVELRRYYAATVEERRCISWNLWHALGATFWPSKRFAEMIGRFAITRGGTEAYVLREAMRCYIGRVRRDEEVREILLSTLRDAQSPDVRVTLSSLLAHAAPTWSDFRDWRNNQITSADKNSTRTIFGYDLASSNVESFFGILVEG